MGIQINSWTIIEENDLSILRVDIILHHTEPTVGAQRTSSCFNKASFDRKTEHPAVSQFLEYQLFWWRFERNFEKQEQRWRSLLGMIFVCFEKSDI